MNTKEKAEELVYKMSYNSYDEDQHCSHYVAKNCSLIAVDEIINNLPLISEIQEYWIEVKQEIEKL